MNRRVILGILLVLVLVAAAVSLGAYVYNLGVAQGMAESVRLSDLPPGAEVRPYPYYGGPFGFYRPFGFLGPFLFIFFFFILFRGLWWGGRWGYGPRWHHDRWPSASFEEWHRRAHSQEAEEKPSSSGE